MRRNSPVYFIVLLLLLSCDTTSNIDPVFRNYFIKYYGEDGNQQGVDLLVSADGSMVLLGNTSSQINPSTQPFIVKVDPMGNVLWQRQLGELGETAVDVELDRLGNLIIVSNIGDESNSRVRLFRIDQQGKGIDSIKIELGEKQVAKSVTQIADNSFLIAGYAEPNPTRNPELIVPPPDEADVTFIRVDEALTTPQLSFIDLGGGEHVGAAVKIFESVLGGSLQYLLFGDSDRPDDGPYKRSFEVIGIDLFGTPTGIRKVSGTSNEIQIAADVIETQGALQDGYLTVGTTYGTNTNDVYITQYDKTLSIKRLDIPLKLNRRLQGVSAAIGAFDDFYILANELRENSRRDIVLLKMSSDGAVLGSTSFGSLAGDDIGGAVRVLPDGRVALLGTIEIETQQKIALMIVSPNGKFSN